MVRFSLLLLVPLWACAGDAPVGDLTDTDVAAAAEGAASPGAGPTASADPAEADVRGPDGPATGSAPAPASRAVDPAAAAPPPVVIPPSGERPRFRRPEHVRGLYLTAWTAGSATRMERIMELARRTEVNALVIDIKDATGYVSHATGVPLAREIGAAGEIRIRDLPGLLRRLEAEGIYPIARIVVVKDPLLVAARPDLAVQDTAGGVWLDGNGSAWLNPYDERVRDYHMALAREVVELGFPEVQWDYIRFADAPRSELARAVYPGSEDGTHSVAIREFLEHSRSELRPIGAVVTADVFGVTTSARDVGIGQIWEDFIDVVDVALPMVYPSHYVRGSFGIQDPNGHPYEVVHEALRRALSRSDRVEGAGLTRPWLQDFDLGKPAYEAPEVRAQIQAAYDLGIREWILWSPSSRYTEQALMPVDGWAEEPRIRVAGKVVPVSRRHEALRLARARGTAEAPGDASRPGGSVESLLDTLDRPSLDTLRPRILDPDSLRRAIDSLLRARDTIPGSGDGGHPLR